MSGMTRGLSVLVMVHGLLGCGAEVATTTATVGQVQATAATQAKAQQEQIKKDLDAALKAGQAAASAAGAQ